MRTNKTIFPSPPGILVVMVICERLLSDLRTGDGRISNRSGVSVPDSSVG